MGILSNGAKMRLINFFGGSIVALMKKITMTNHPVAYRWRKLFNLSCSFPVAGVDLNLVLPLAQRHVGRSCEEIG